MDSIQEEGQKHETTPLNATFARENASALGTGQCRRPSILSMRQTNSEACNCHPIVQMQTIPIDPVDEKEIPITTGTASILDTVMNIVKTCMGTGILALPYAANQVGCWIHWFGLIGIALWCTVCVERLLSCLEWIKILVLLKTRIKEKHRVLGSSVDNEVAVPPNGCSGIGEVAFYAFGPKGLEILNYTFALLLFMIIVAYLAAVNGFLEDTFLTTQHKGADLVVPSIVIGLLSNVPDMAFLAKFSALGIAMIVLVFGVIIIEGIMVDEHSDSFISLQQWPRNGLASIGQWYGCTIFGFGLVPLTYNLRVSMKEPQKMLFATGLGVSGTAAAYIVLSTIALLLFPTIQGDLLQVLPKPPTRKTGDTIDEYGNDNFFIMMRVIIPTLVRLAMVVVAMTSAPLLVLPCGELIEDELSFYHHERVRVVVRIGICVLAAVVTCILPGFVYVLSFVGSCWCVLSFIAPPLFHLSLLWQVQSLQRQQHIQPQEEVKALVITFTHATIPTDMPKVSQTSILWDIILLVWGLLATLVSSFYTFSSLVNPSSTES